MKLTLSTYEAAERLFNDENANWTRAGAFALVKYLEELEEDIGDFVSSIDVPFLQGDMMVLYSDGVTEAESESGELYEMDRLIASALRHHHKTAPQAVDAIIADLRAHIGTQKVHDDITLVVLKHR